MTIEFFTFVVTLFGALIAAISSLAAESKRLKYGLIILSGVIALVSALTLLEGSERSKNKDQRAGEIERNWLRMAGSDVLGWQFELVVDRGFVRLTETLPYLQKIKFAIQGTGAGESPVFAQDFANLFTVETIRKSGLFGDPTVTFAKDEQGRDYPRQVECVASGYATRTVLANLSKMIANRSDYVCSIRVSVILSQHGPPLTDLLRGKRVSLTMPALTGGALKCAGPCKNIYIGVRAIVPPPSDVDEPLVEISPAILSFRPQSESDGLMTFSLPGDAALELAKSSYEGSFGYADVESFPLTTGFFHRLYRTHTRRQELVTEIGPIWSTTTSDADLRADLDPSIRNRAVLFALPDWCGFGDARVNDDPNSSPFCWHRYLPGGTEHCEIGSSVSRSRRD